MLFDSLAMLEGTIHHRLRNQYCLDFVHMSYYGDQTHCENHDCVGQLEIDQTGYLLTHPRTYVSI